MGKGFELLELVGQSRNGMSGKEIAESLGLPISTTFRQLKFLTECGFLRNIGGVYTLGGTLIRLGNAATRQNPLSRIGHLPLLELSEATSETVHLSEKNGKDVIYIEKVEGSRPIRMGSMIGKTAPLYCTGVGKAILAFLPEAEREKLLQDMELTAYTPNTITDRKKLTAELAEIRRLGYAVDDCENEPGVFCVASPIFNSLGEVTGAVSVSGSELYLRNSRECIAAKVMNTAHLISAQLR